MKFKKDEADQHRIVVGKVVVLLGLVVHLLHSLSTWSIITDQWLESTGIVPDALKAEKNASMIRWNSNVSILTTNKTIVSPNVLHRHRPIDDQRLTTFSKENEFQDLRAPLFSNRIQLLELVQTGPDPQCHSTDNHNMSLFHSIILDESMTHIPKRQIPKIIHMTSKSRCMTQKVKANILKWRLPGYSIYFHDDAAVNRLLEKYFPAFPHLQMIKECSISGAAKADIWRYLVLWEYGGVYTGKFMNDLLRSAHIIFLFSRQHFSCTFVDIDNAPGILFKDGAVIEDNDEAWFVVERIGVISQYFMASSPNHPFMFIALMQCLYRLVSFVDDIGTQYVPYITGPGVTKAAMMLFMKDTVNFETVKAGTYQGIDGSHITVVGSRKKSHRWIIRESISGKRSHYAAMNMTHFNDEKHELKDSCYEHVYKQAIRMREANAR